MLKYIVFPLILLQAKAGGQGIRNKIVQKWRIVSINSPSGEGGGVEAQGNTRRITVSFPLILLQAKAGGFQFFLNGKPWIAGFH